MINIDDIKLIINSYYLIFSSITTAGTGFFFWLIASKLFPVDNIGTSSAIISIMGFISIISILGIDQTLIRYLSNNNDKGEFILNCVIIVLISSIVITLFSLLIIYKYININFNIYIIIILLLGNISFSLFSLLINGIFIGINKSIYSFLFSILSMFRLLFLPIFSSAGLYGLLISYFIMPLIASIIGIYLINKKYKLKYKNKNYLLKYKNYVIYSLSNYIARLMDTAPTFVLPIIVFQIYGANINAYFYISWQITSLLLIISKSTANILIAENNNNTYNTKNNFIKGTILIYISLILLILILFFYIEDILYLYGNDAEYVINSAYMIKILAISSIPYSVISLIGAYYRIKQKNKHIILLYSINTILFFILLYPMNIFFNFNGILYSWIISNSFTSLFFIINIIIKNNIKYTNIS